MFFEEKIELLKKQFPPAHFRVPFTDASHILKAIEKRFIIVKDIAANLNNLAQYHSHWSENLRNKVTINSMECGEHMTCIETLDQDKNYWVVLGGPGNWKNRIFDCKPAAINPLCSLTSYDFFIVDKKYTWLAAFVKDAANGRMLVYRSDTHITPFG